MRVAVSRPGWVWSTVSGFRATSRDVAIAVLRRLLVQEWSAVAG